MEKDIDMFIEEIRVNRNASRNTCLSYGRDLRKFMEYLLNRGISRWSRVSEKIIKNYLDYLYKLGRVDSTVSRTIASFKSFFGYLYENSLIMENPADALVSPKVRKNKPRTLSEDEMSAFFSQNFGTTPKGIRDRTMLRLISATGIRVTELVGLRLSDVDLDAGELVVEGRGKEKKIGLEEDIVALISYYLKNARPSLVTDESDLLFTNYAGGAMSRQGFWKMLKNYTGTLESDVRVTPHTFTNYYKVFLR